MSKRSVRDEKAFVDYFSSVIPEFKYVFDLIPYKMYCEHIISAVELCPSSNHHIRISAQKSFIERIAHRSNLPENDEIIAVQEHDNA